MPASLSLDVTISTVEEVEPIAAGDAIAATLAVPDGRVLKLVIPVEVGEALIERLDQGLNQAALARRERDNASLQNGPGSLQP